MKALIVYILFTQFLEAYIKKIILAIGRPKEAVLVLFQVVGLLALIYGFTLDFKWQNWLLAAFGYFCMFGLGITVTFHRLLAHRSYQLWRPFEALFALFANLGCTGSSVGWIFVHRMHHKYSDKKGDPHSPLVHGKVGAVIGDYGAGFDKWMVRDIIEDPVHRFYHDYYHLIIIGVAATFAFISTELFVFGFAIPVFLNTAASRLSNWIDHEPRFGARKFITTDHSHNVWWWSLLTFGEGWHNNHHSHPGSYKFGFRWYQVDIGRTVIEFLALLKFAKIAPVKIKNET